MTVTAEELARITDPMERMVALALSAAGINYVTDVGGSNPSNLDFKLTDSGVEIEVKQFHSERIAEQMSRVPDVIAIQGRRAVEWFCARLGEEAPGLYSAQFGAVHHDDYSGYLFTVDPPKFAEQVAEALNRPASRPTTPEPKSALKYVVDGAGRGTIVSTATPETDHVPGVRNMVGPTPSHTTTTTLDVEPWLTDDTSPNLLTQAATPEAQPAPLNACDNSDLSAKTAAQPATPLATPEAQLAEPQFDNGMGARLGCAELIDGGDHPRWSKEGGFNHADDLVRFTQADLTAQLAARDALIAKQSEVLNKAAGQFAFYAAEHAKKGTREANIKGANNHRWSVFCSGGIPLAEMEGK